MGCLVCICDLVATQTLTDLVLCPRNCFCCGVWLQEFYFNHTVHSKQERTDMFCPTFLPVRKDATASTAACLAPITHVARETCALGAGSPRWSVRDLQ